MIKRTNTKFTFRIAQALRGLGYEKKYTKILYSRIFGIKELVWNQRETQVMAAILDSLNILLQELDLKPFKISKHHIHILSAKEYYKHFRKQSVGKFEFGHIYIQRSKNGPWFISTFTHELIHLISFYGLQVTITHPRKRAKFAEDIILRYSGLSYTDSSYTKDFFLGLNEAVTELFSAMVLNMYYHTYIVNKKYEKCFSKPNAYLPQIQIFQKILHCYAEKNINQTLAKQFLKDYILGTHKAIKKFPPQIQIALSDMLPTDKSAYETAKKLKFYTLAKEIKTKYLPKHKSKPKLPH